MGTSAVGWYVTPRETALMSYFYAVATDPRMKAAGYSPAKLRDALLACIAEDVPAVFAIALRGKIADAEKPVREATRNVMGTVLGGTVPPRVSEHVASAMDEMIGEGARRIGDWLKTKSSEGRPHKTARNGTAR